MNKTKKYIVLDTNIFVSFLETGFLVAQESGFKEPEDIKVLENLLKILDKDKAELILPEIIILECQRIKAEKDEELDKIYNKAIISVQDTNIFNKKIAQKPFENIKESMLRVCKKEKNRNIRIWRSLENIFGHRNTHFIKLSQELLFEAYKRGLSGKKPFVMRFSNSKDQTLNNKPIFDIQPDCIILESIIYFLKNKTNYETYICTNDNNFYISNEKKQLDINIQKEMNIKYFFLSLSELLNKAFGVKSSKSKKTKITKNLDAFPLVEKGATDAGKGIEISEVVKNLE